MNAPLHWENLAKRLLSLMSMGAYLTSDSGHIWINYDDTEDHYLENVLRREGISVNSKVYGGVLEALNIIDKALDHAGQPSLLEQWDEDYMFLGEDTLRPGRIDFVVKLKGGIG